MNPILEKAYALQSEVTNFLRQIVAIPSFSGKEGNVVARIKQEMETIGFDEVRIDGFGNVMGRLGNGPKVLVIDGHCDTVEVGNESLWHMDPFQGDLKDGIIYGRGCCDQKGGVASAVYAGKILKEIGIPSNLTIWVVASVQEEDCDGLCWKYILEQDNLKPDLVIITEPTNLNIYRGHRGRMEMKVRTEGISCHGSAPERGENAIYKMAGIISDIEKLHPRLHNDPFLGKGSVTISEIKSTSPSLCAVADSCTIHLDRRLTWGETLETSIKEIEDLPSFQKAKAKVWVEEYKLPTHTGKVYPMQSYFPTWVMEESHPYIQTSVSVFEKLFEKAPKVDKWTFSTNGIATMGLFHVPTLGFGPGNEFYAHSPNEQIPVEHLVHAMAFYAQYATDMN